MEEEGGGSFRNSEVARLSPCESYCSSLPLSFFLHLPVWIGRFFPEGLIYPTPPPPRSSIFTPPVAPTPPRGKRIFCLSWQGEFWFRVEYPLKGRGEGGFWPCEKKKGKNAGWASNQTCFTFPCHLFVFINNSGWWSFFILPPPFLGSYDEMRVSERPVLNLTKIRRMEIDGRNLL